MKTIHKFRFRSGVLMPKTAQPLSVGIQNDEIVVWALVDKAEPATVPILEAIGIHVTGGTGMIRGRFLGTVQRSDGYVFHVFDTSTVDEQKEVA